MALSIIVGSLLAGRGGLPGKDVMLDNYYTEPRALQRARTCASGPYLEAFADGLDEAGYSRGTILTLLRTATHLGLWVDREGISIRALDDGSIERFGLHLRRCACPGPRPPRRRRREIAARAKRFLEHLREAGVVRPAPIPEVADKHPVRASFEAWMRVHRGAAPATLRIYGRVVTDALGALGDDPKALNARALRDFVLDRSRQHGRSKAKQVMSAMRAFMKFLVATGSCRSGLDGAIPTIAHWRMASLPRGLSASDVERVIATCTPTTPTGVRNRPILLLLARLGLRAGEVAMLRLEDIDWSGATLRVAGKSRRATRLPLPQEVGDAILSYLPQRPTKPRSDRVFLRLSPPCGPLASGSVTSIASRALRLAGVVAPARGAHALRHSAASGLLREGASLDQIRLILRHQDPETTMLYAKVDVALLRRVVQLWPEVAPC